RWGDAGGVAARRARAGHPSQSHQTRRRSPHRRLTTRQILRIATFFLALLTHPWVTAFGDVSVEFRNRNSAFEDAIAGPSPELWVDSATVVVAQPSQSWLR